MLTRVSKTVRALWGSRTAAFISTAILFYIVSAAANYGFMNKWALRDHGDDRFSFQTMLDGNATRPFVYRQLIPRVANTADLLVPESIQDQIIRTVNIPKFYNSKIQLSEADEYAFRYRVVMLLNFGGLFLALILLRIFLLKCGYSRQAALFAPVLFILAFPYLETVGGYFYDCWEIVFFTAAVLLAWQGHWLALVVLSCAATLNKESFLFLIPTLFPFLCAHFSKKKSATLVLMAGGISLATNLLVKFAYSYNPGGMVEFNLQQHIRALLSPGSLFDVEVTYGMISPRGFSIITVLLLIYLVKFGRSGLSRPMQQHAWIALAINLPLYFLFCWPGELRNLSLLYPTAVALLAGCIQRIDNASTA